MNFIAMTVIGKLKITRTNRFTPKHGKKDVLHEPIWAGY
jgi:hypothetical protein